MMNFTPEQQRAFEVFEDQLANERPALYHSWGPEMFPTNYVAFSTTPFNNASLPKGKTWVWNQSSGKAWTTLPKEQSVAFYKMNVRKRRGCQSSPSYKIWVFIIYKYDVESRYFLWCEKGEGISKSFSRLPAEFKLLKVNPPLPELFPLLSFESSVSCTLDVNDFKFLQPFMNDSTADDLGWHE